eukprot:1774618-Lingulodinium_polyedra.AAC.1
MGWLPEANRARLRAKACSADNRSCWSPVSFGGTSSASDSPVLGLSGAARCCPAGGSAVLARPPQGLDAAGVAA